MSRETLRILEEKERCLERDLARTKQELVVERERLKVEARIAKDQQRLKELQEDPTGERARAAQIAKAKKEAQEHEEWLRTRPPYWPLPHPGMSQEEQNKYWEDNDL